MKTLNIHRISFLFILVFAWMTAKGQQWEVPGDHFSLEGALEMFKQSASPEEFERMLNDPEARVNNLDLNGDGYIDYIRVIDYYEGNVHAFVLQAAISEYQNQDVAVITLEKLADGRAILQITGDADIYGVETIIEPTREVRTYAGANTSRVVVNVWAWPMVRYVYDPYYRVWVSPWGWHARPYWWSPWRPAVYYDYYAYWRPFRSYYSVCYTRRVVYAHTIYRPYRTTSVIVHNRHHHRIKKYRSAYITRGGRYQPRDDRYRDRRSNTVRYRADGRIATASNERISSGGSSRNRLNEGRTPVRRENGNTFQRSSRSNERYSENPNTRRSTGRSNNTTGLSRTERNSATQDLRGRSYENSGLRRSDARTNNESGHPGSTRNSSMRRSDIKSSGNADIRRPQQGSESNAGYRKSFTGSSSRESFTRPSNKPPSRSSVRSSGSRQSNGNSSGIQRSTNRSSKSSSTPSRSSGNSDSGKRRR